MMGALRLRIVSGVTEEGGVLPLTNNVVRLGRRRRTRENISASNALHRSVVVALSLVVLLCLVTGCRFFPPSSLLGYATPAQMEAFAPPFPPYGSPEFQKRCPWISLHRNKQGEGKVYVTTLPESNKGLAQWVSGIGTGYILAEFFQTALYIDFAPNVDILQIMESIVIERNWSLPANFECSENCRKVYGVAAEGRSYSFSGQILPRVPVYRHASKKQNKMNVIHDDEFGDLRRTIPGFRIRDGFACAFQSLIRLSSSKSIQYQPDLFRMLLPALSDPSTLVLSLYVRTGYKDEIVQAEEEGRAWPDPGNGSSRPSKAVAECALELENMSLKKVLFGWCFLTPQPARNGLCLPFRRTRKKY